MAAALEVPALTTELVCAPVEIRDGAGAITDPTAMILRLAVPATGVQPSTWYGGSWETRTAAYTWRDDEGRWHTWQPPVYLARLLVGPAGGAVALAVGGVYDLWVDIAPGGVERIVRPSGLVRAV